MRRCDAEQDGLLPGRLSQSSDRKLLNRPQTAMRNPKAVSGGSRGEIPLLNQGNPEAPETRVPGNRSAMNATSHDEEVETLTLELTQITPHNARPLP